MEDQSRSTPDGHPIEATLIWTLFRLLLSTLQAIGQNEEHQTRPVLMGWLKSGARSYQKWDNTSCLLVPDTDREPVKHEVLTQQLEKPSRPSSTRTSSHDSVAPNPWICRPRRAHQQPSSWTYASRGKVRKRSGACCRQSTGHRPPGQVGDSKEEPASKASLTLECKPSNPSNLCCANAFVLAYAWCVQHANVTRTVAYGEAAKPGEMSCIPKESPSRRCPHGGLC